jgi:hypothetical protein
MQQPFDEGEKPRTDVAVGGAMVTRERCGHHRAHGHGTVVGPDPVGDLAEADQRDRHGVTLSARQCSELDFSHRVL